MLKGFSRAATRVAMALRARKNTERMVTDVMKDVDIVSIQELRVYRMFQMQRSQVDWVVRNCITRCGD
jgi:hypothetical protein